MFSHGWGVYHLFDVPHWLVCIPYHTLLFIFACDLTYWRVKGDVYDFRKSLREMSIVLSMRLYSDIGCLEQGRLS